MSIEAMKQALEALELFVKYENPNARIQVRKPKDGGPMVTIYPKRVAYEAATALRQAIEQAEQAQPVAWVVEDQHGERLEWAGDIYSVPGLPTFPLYTAPPPHQPWVWLTGDEIEDALPSGIYDCLADPWDCGVGDGDEMRSIKKDVLRIVLAIEAKLKEKNT